MDDALLHRLIRDAKNGDDRAFEKIAAGYVGMLKGIVRLYFAPGMEWDDLYVEAQFALWKAVLDFKPGQASFHSFALQVVTRQIITVVKTATRKKHSMLNESIRGARDEEGEYAPITDTLPGVPGRTDPVEVLAIRDEMQSVLNGIAGLTEKESAALLGITSGLSYAEISPHTKQVDNSIQRAKRKLHVERAVPPEWAGHLSEVAEHRRDYKPPADEPVWDEEKRRMLPAQGARCQALVDLGPKMTALCRSQCSYRRVEGEFCRRHSVKRVGERGAPLAPVARLTPRRNVHRPYTRAEITAAIRAHAREHGWPPTADEWSRGGDHPNTNAAVRHFGSWANAIEAAGFERPRRGVKRSDRYRPPDALAA